MTKTRSAKGMTAEIEAAFEKLPGAYRADASKLDKFKPGQSFGWMFSVRVPEASPANTETLVRLHAYPESRDALVQVFVTVNDTDWVSGEAWIDYSDRRFRTGQDFAEHLLERACCITAGLNLVAVFIRTGNLDDAEKVVAEARYLWGNEHGQREGARPTPGWAA